jgi:flagellar motor switch protein FliM
MLMNLRDPLTDSHAGPKPTPDRSQIERLFYSLPLKLSGKVASLNLTVAQLAKIKPGDIIPMSINDPVPVYIGKEQIFDANIAEDHSKLFLCGFNDRTIEKPYE